MLFDRSLATGLYDHIISVCQAAEFSPKVFYSTALMTTVLTMVASEQGISIVPEGVQNLRNNQVRFVPIIPAPNPIPFIISWHSKMDSPPRDAFLALIKEQTETIQKNFLQP